MRTHAWIIALLGILVLPALAADIDGKWVAQVPGRDGQTRESTFTFKAEGDKLTGTVSNPRGEVPISEGKISGDEISFVVTLSFGGNEVRLLHKGKVAGNEIKFTRQREGGQGRTQEFVAKRVS